MPFRGCRVVPHGRTVCSCFGVSVEEVLAQIASQSLTTLADLGRILRAGTNCGSCIPELKVLLADADGKQRCMDRSTV
jgi:assimilatory nitrate reductase catalytic subunit